MIKISTNCLLMASPLTQAMMMIMVKSKNGRVMIESDPVRGVKNGGGQKTRVGSYERGEDQWHAGEVRCEEWLWRVGRRRLEKICEQRRHEEVTVGSVVPKAKQEKIDDMVERFKVEAESKTKG